MHIDFSSYSAQYKPLIKLGIPIIIGQIGTIVLSFADTIMIGHHSTPELAAAAFVSQL
ncbi:MAG: MATE family efflux transporter, partial [Prevotella sp.]|nr:MATE family efflux transporter [Prevotella sp.]